MPSSHAQFLWAGKTPCAKCSRSWRITTGERALSIELSEFVSVRVPPAEGHSFLRPLKSASGLAYSKTLRELEARSEHAPAFGVRSRNCGTALGTGVQTVDSCRQPRP